jgi:RNA polymerase sigma factor (sigma-70 family)
MNEDSLNLRQAFEKLKVNPHDESAWRVFLGPVSRSILFSLYQMSGAQKELCQDLLQDVLLRFLETNSLQKVSDVDAAISYLQAMARNRLVDHFRSVRLRKSVAEAALGVLTSPAAADPSQSENFIGEELLRLSHRLSKEDQELVQRIVGTGANIRSLAAAMGISYSNAAVRLFRLRKRLEALT